MLSLHPVCITLLSPARLVMPLSGDIPCPSLMLGYTS